MPPHDEAPNIAVFCDFENIALGAREAKFDRFDIQLALERLLEKGNVVVKKAYADWTRFKSAKRQMHEAGFELIEIPHVTYSGKNSADIRLVVDALDLCYTKGHVHTFAILSGDSDFSPLVSKLRENDKRVVGLGVKQSTSDLLVENCDEFIYYDDLVRRKRAERARRGRRRTAERAPAASPAEPQAPEAPPHDERPPPKSSANGDDLPAGSKEEALELVLDTVEALFQERGDNLWGSMVKQTLRRKRPNFNETFYGYRSFNDLLEDAERQGLLVLQKDEKSGGYLIVSFGPNA